MDCQKNVLDAPNPGVFETTVCGSREPLESRGTHDPDENEESSKNEPGETTDKKPGDGSRGDFSSCKGNEPELSDGTCPEDKQPTCESGLPIPADGTCPEGYPQPPKTIVSYQCDPLSDENVQFGKNKCAAEGAWLSYECTERTAGLGGAACPCRSSGIC